MAGYRSERTPGFKLAPAIVVGLVLTVPLFSVWLLVYDRKSQSEEATASITEGWGESRRIEQDPSWSFPIADRDRNGGRERAKRNPQPRRGA